MALFVLSILRVVFAGWIRRQGELLRRHERTAEKLTVTQSVLFIVVVLAALGSVAFTLDRLPLLWS